MKKLIPAIKAFFCILISDQHCIITIHKNEYLINADILVKNFKQVSDELIDNAIGQAKTLDNFKEILKNAK